MTELVAPRSLADAVRVLAEKPGVRPIAGCTDLMVGQSSQERHLETVLDLLQVPELRGVRQRDGLVEIGATTTFSELRVSAPVVQFLPALAAAAAVIGGWQIQNRATIGGNVVNASPAGDSLPVLLALDAVAVAVGVAGEREIPIAEFFTDYRKTALESGEMLAWVRVPLPAPGARQFFRKVGTREAQAISKVVVALVGRLDGDVVADYRLAAGSVAPTPIRLPAVEDELVGRSVSREAADRAGELAAGAVEPIDDVRSTAEYRRFALGRVVRRLTLGLFASA